MAQRLITKFPGLQWEQISNENDHYIHIFGKLNDYWFDEYNKAVFQIGELN